MTQSNHSDQTAKTRTDAASLLRTPLYTLHTESSARMTPFSGWEMPVQYNGIGQEHEAVRQTVGMFDISHMGKFRLVGRDLMKQLQRLVPSDLLPLRSGLAQYTVLLNPEAGIIDDLIVYYQGTDASGHDHVRLIVNASTVEKDKTWLLQQLDPSVQFDDQSLGTVLIALQGPQAIATLQALTPLDLTTIPRFGHAIAPLCDSSAFLARTGYTGEDGFEIWLEASAGQALWRSLRDAGVMPCGLGARDTLRLEAAMALYGQDIDDTTTPLEAGLGWLVHLDRKGDFIGRSRLEQQKQEGVPRRFVGLQMQGRNIARHDYPVRFEGERVGVVTSGTLAPTVGKPIALAYVPPHLAQVGQALEVEIRGKSYPATVVKRPFYKSPHL